jgi:hypothetical protein
MELPNVTRWRSCSARSRAAARARVAFVGSMSASLAQGAEPYLGAGWEVAESRREGGEYTLVEFNGAALRRSRPRSSVAPGARRAH